MMDAVLYVKNYLPGSEPGIPVSELFSFDNLYPKYTMQDNLW